VQVVRGSREAGRRYNQRFTKYWQVSTNMEFGAFST
jgi:hypothetical protein